MFLLEQVRKKFDLVDMCVANVTSLFGSFVKFLVEEVGEGPSGLILPGKATVC